jgi:hypothetical protein
MTGSDGLDFYNPHLEIRGFSSNFVTLKFQETKIYDKYRSHSLHQQQ